MDWRIFRRVMNETEKRYVICTGIFDKIRYMLSVITNRLEAVSCKTK